MTEIIEKEDWKALSHMWQKVLAGEIEVVGELTTNQLEAIRRRVKTVEVLSLGSLNGEANKISLIPLQFSPALKTIYLRQNTLDDLDLSPLASVKMLRKLSISVYGDQVHDYVAIDAIGECVNLEELDLSEVRIADPSPIANLTLLHGLTLRYRSAMGSMFHGRPALTVFAGLRKLTHLCLDGPLGFEKIEMDAISNFQQLIELHLSPGAGIWPAEILNPSPLRNLTQLRKLYLYGYNVSALRGIWSLRLDVLHVSGIFSEPEWLSYCDTHPECDAYWQNG